MRIKTGKFWPALLIAGTVASLYGMLSAEAANEPVARTIDVKVTVAGYEPDQIRVGPNEKVVLRVTRTTDATCATEIVVPDAHVKKDLPLNVPVLVNVGTLGTGQHQFGCGMSLMVSGMLTVGEANSKKKAP